MNRALALPARHEGQPLEQMHVLLVLQQRAVQFRQAVLTISLQILWRQILGQQQLQPIQHFAGGGFFLQPRRLANLKELRQRGGQQRRFDIGEMHLHNRRQHHRDQQTSQRCCH